MKNVIMRPVFNRPEMLFLSIESEIKARDYFEFSYDLTTLFIVEFQAHPLVLKLIEDYPYPKRVIQRPKKFGLSKNILDGMKDCFGLSENFIVYIEDDVVLHINILLNMFNDDEYSILSPYNGNDGGKVNEIYKGHFYTALAPLINKKFFKQYVSPCIGDLYYETFTTRNNFCVSLDKKYKKNGLYKYRNNPGMHNEQAGLINRLVDVAFIEENKFIATPLVNRQQHIGYFGKNRPGGLLPGKNFEERLSNLRNIILDANKMYELSASKQYNDYKIFSPKLKEWDGNIVLKEEEVIK